ncbi:MAG TPA: hypothetical protein VK171_10315 [Fimbriimonas sp.]|nr:hypothetical protein [Fimbriimonas sp.]
MRLNSDLTDARWIHIKGWLFLVVAGLSAAGLLASSMSFQNVALLGLCVWAACRWYYYMFYVVEKYVDPGFRFAGLIDFLRYLAKRPKS